MNTAVAPVAADRTGQPGRSLAVLWQNEHFPDIAKGGGGAVNTRYICKALGGFGHRPTVLARLARPGLPSNETVDGIRVVRLDPPVPPRGLWPLWPLVEARALRARLAPRARDFDFFCAVDSSYALALKALFPDRSLLYRVEGLPSDRGRIPAPGSLARRAALRLLDATDQLAERLAWRRADVIVVKSNFMGRVLTGRYRVPPAKVAVIPNGVDFERFARAEVQSGLLDRFGRRDGSPVVIAFAGRLVAMKNVSALLEAFALMRRRADAVLLVVGDGDQRPALEDHARRLGVAERCVFTGLVEHVESVLVGADIFVLPSTYEPFGNALVEAMAAGLAPVAFHPDDRRVRTASAEILRDGETGLLVQPPDPEALARALDRLVQDAGLRRRLGRQAQEECGRRFSWDRCATRYLELAAEAGRR
jgi:glycosyltransferase involved in cell wall biosynthesis